MHRIRVVVAACRTLFRQGLTALIGADPDFEICGEACDADETRRLCARAEPEIIVLETELLDAGNDCGMIPCLRVACPAAAVVVIREAGNATLTEEEAENELRAEKARVLQEGAAAWVPGDIDQTELRRILRTIAATRHCFEEDAGASIRAAAKSGTANGRHAVTERESTIIRLIAEGMCNKEVAHRLGISTQTVKNHVSHLLEKLALADRTQLAVYAIEHNFEF